MKSIMFIFLIIVLFSISLFAQDIRTDLWGVTYESKENLTGNYQKQAAIIFDLMKKYPDKDNYCVTWFVSPRHVDTIGYNQKEDSINYVSIIEGSFTYKIYKGAAKERLKKAMENNEAYNFPNDEITKEGNRIIYSCKQPRLTKGKFGRIIGWIIIPALIIIFIIKKRF